MNQQVRNHIGGSYVNQCYQLVIDLDTVLPGRNLILYPTVSSVENDEWRSFTVIITPRRDPVVL